MSKISKKCREPMHIPLHSSVFKHRSKHWPSVWPVWVDIFRVAYSLHPPSNNLCGHFPANLVMNILELCFDRSLRHDPITKQSNLLYRASRYLRSSSLVKLDNFGINLEESQKKCIYNSTEAYLISINKRQDHHNLECSRS